MKNIPHQFSNLSTLSGALGVISKLAASNRDVADDGIFGEALAHAGVYNFRNLAGSVADRLTLEKLKPKSDQGFRTAARDIRRFFTTCRLLEKSTNSYVVTKLAQDILDAGDNESLSHALWREAMLNMQLPHPDDTSRVSHPYRILTKLVADHPGMAVSELLLALEAKDDGEAEYARINSLVGLGRDRIIATIAITEFNANNAVKILPAIAEQLGDISRIDGKAYIALPPITPTEDVLDEPVASSDPVVRAVTAATISPVPNFTPQSAATFDLSAAIAMRHRRTVSHHEAVMSIARLCEQNGYSLSENPYDCLAFKTAVGSILIEVKTLDGSASDERRQAEKALGQLKGYSHFNVPAVYKEPRYVEVAAFTAQPSLQTISFLRANQVEVAWLKDGQWFTADRNGNAVNLSVDSLLTLA